MIGVIFIGYLIMLKNYFKLQLNQYLGILVLLILGGCADPLTDEEIRRQDAQRRYLSVLENSPNHRWLPDDWYYIGPEIKKELGSEEAMDEFLRMFYSIENKRIFVVSREVKKNDYIEEIEEAIGEVVDRFEDGFAEGDFRLHMEMTEGRFVPEKEVHAQMEAQRQSFSESFLFFKTLEVVLINARINGWGGRNTLRRPAPTPVPPTPVPPTPTPVLSYFERYGDAFLMGITSLKDEKYNELFQEFGGVSEVGDTISVRLRSGRVFSGEILETDQKGLLLRTRSGLEEQIMFDEVDAQERRRVDKDLVRYTLTYRAMLYAYKQTIREYDMASMKLEENLSNRELLKLGYPPELFLRCNDLEDAALRYYLLSALVDYGMPEAKVELAKVYFQGQVVGRNDTEALNLLSSAEQDGYNEASELIRQYKASQYRAPTPTPAPRKAKFAVCTRCNGRGYRVSSFSKDSENPRKLSCVCGGSGKFRVQ